MKNYFSAILLGSLFSCSLFPIGITDEPDTLIDCSSEPDVMSVEYESYDRAHAHYLIHLTWTDHAGNEWSQRGRLAKLKNRFYRQDKRKLIDLRSFDKTQIFYFLPRAEPNKTKCAPIRLIRRLFESDDESIENNEQEESIPVLDHNDNNDGSASEVEGAAQNDEDSI